MPIHTITCPICKRTVQKYVSNLDRIPIYCSWDCFVKSKRGKSSPLKNQTRVPRLLVHCLNCGQEMHVTQSRLNAGRGKFCSRACSTQYHHLGRPKPKSRKNIKSAIQSIRGRPPANKKAWIKKICPICCTSFEVPQRREHTAKYCSLECAHEAKRRIVGPDHPLFKSIEMTCELCGRSIWVKPSKASEFRFCSRKCAGTYISAQQAKQSGPTSIEALLLQELDRQSIRYRFQHLIAVWLIDITIPQYRIAIEADGDYWHSSAQQQKKDANKDRWLHAHKWTVFRFSGTEIRASPQKCIDKVADFILQIQAE